MSETQGQLFSMEVAREKKERAQWPPEVLILGDLLHDAGYHQEANDLLELHRGYAEGMEYYQGILAPPDLEA